MEIDDLHVPANMAVVGDDNTDGERTEKLTIKVMKLLKEHLSGGPLGPGRVFECLNALAVNAAVLIAGTEEGPALGDLFITSLNANLELYYKAQKDEQKAN